MATEPVSKLLGDNAELKPLAARLEQIRRLQRRYRSLAPERLADSSRVCAIDGTTVVVCADSGPVAAALRQLAPRLLAGLREFAQRNSKHPKDQELNSIRVEVQVTNPKPKRQVVTRGELPVDKLAALAGRLSDSPLKSELERISQPDQSKRTRSKT